MPLYAYNSYIKIKQKECKTCRKPKHIFSHGNCVDCAKLLSVHKNTEKEDGLSDMIADADALFSKYIRTKNITKDGIAVCYTCDKKARWQEMDCGHYISRSHHYLRFSEDNTRTQCNACNRLKHGNLPEFTRRLELENSGITESLLEQSRIVYKYSKEELRDLISELTRKLKLINLK